MYPTITKVEYLRDYHLRLSFDTGEVGNVDLANFIASAGPMFDCLQEKSYFSQVALELDFRTLVWPNGIDIDPDFLYEHTIKEQTVVPA